MARNAWTVLSLAIFGILAVLVGCSSEEDRVEPLCQPDQFVIGEEPGPGEFVAGYASSELFFTRTSEFVSASGPHGDVRIWYSKNIEELIDNMCFIVPEGTTAIKEEDFSGSGEVEAMVLMIKKDDAYDPENNNWYYEQLDEKGDPTGDESDRGKIGSCIDCHSQFADFDYLGGTKLKSGE
ncbi:MAG: hypothetical protein C4523_04455 [Myxococcales bacterium]|nr:MAG: hypothetical protein C4523_04455 [Myxococcales bacterium]